MIVPSEKQKKFLTEAASLYHSQLWDDDEAQRYVAGRGITREAASQFQLGVVRKSVPGHEHYLNRISFPYYTTTGVTTIKFRYLGDHENTSAKKYLYLRGDTPRIYNVTAIGGASRIYVCEGETDTIVATMAGLTAIGIPGATAYKSVFARILRHREVVVLADNDDAGQGAAFADAILQTVDSGEKVLMPTGHDVCSYVAAYGLEALRGMVGDG